MSSDHFSIKGVLQTEHSVKGRQGFMGERFPSSKEMVFFFSLSLLQGPVLGACANWIAEQNLLLGKTGSGVHSRSTEEVSLRFASTPGWMWEPDFIVHNSVCGGLGSPFGEDVNP